MVKKSSHPISSIKEGCWANFRDAVKAVDPELFQIIEQISPSEKYKLFEVTYLYGEKITDLGTICLPDKNGHVYKLDDHRLPNEYREQLGYAPTPLILQLTKSSEVFVDTGERIIPLNVFIPGDLYGLFEAIMPLTSCPIAPCWSVTAGARSVFLGAKVTDAISHKRLRAEYGVNAVAPKRLIDQWDIIKTIGNRSNVDSPWASKILVFAKDWLVEQPTDIGWLSFHNHLLKKSWNQSKYMRSKSELSIMWEAFASAVRDRNLKPGPYILANIMHNIFLANGAIPGFTAADTSELLLPSRAVEEAYENVYLLKEYASIIMHPWRLGTMNINNPIYYSLAYPTMIEGTPAIRHAPSVISEIRDIRLLMHTLERILQQHGDLTYSLIKGTTFDYFHTESDRFKEVENSKTIVDGDPYLAECTKRFKDKIFPYQGPFFRGCIRVTKKLPI
jgi:hypothetical protein